MARPKPARRLIVNADDFGRSSSINQAVIRAHREGILTTASLMVNEPAADEAVALARANPLFGDRPASGASCVRRAPPLPADRRSPASYQRFAQRIQQPPRPPSVGGISARSGCARNCARRFRRSSRGSTPPASRWTTSTAISICISIRQCLGFSWRSKRSKFRHPAHAPDPRPLSGSTPAWLRGRWLYRIGPVTP